MKRRPALGCSRREPLRSSAPSCATIASRSARLNPWPLGVEHSEATTKIRRNAVILVATFGALGVGAVAYASHQYQRVKMKATITHMRVLSNALDALNKHVGTCEEAAKAVRAPLRCADSWGDTIALRQSKSDPRQYVIWCQGSSPETARFVYESHHGFVRLPENAPP